MKKQLINEVHRMQQIAGIKSLYIDLHEDDLNQGEGEVEDIDADTSNIPNLEEGEDITKDTVNFDDKYSEDKFNRFVAAARSITSELEAKGGSTGNIINYLKDVVKETAMPAINEVDMDLNTDDDLDDSLQKVIAYDKDDEDSEDAPEEKDTWYAVSDDSFDNDKEPTGKDIKTTAGVDTSKQGKLIALQAKKDDLLAKWRANIISKEEYIEQMGTTPQQIKNLQAAIDDELNVNDDEEEA